MPHEKGKPTTLKAVPRSADLPVSGDPDVDVKECLLCYGTGMEVVPGKGARICACRRLQKQFRQFEGVRLPKRYNGFHLNNYKPQNDLQRRALRRATQFTHEFPAVDQGLLFMGSVGVGKTHLAVSILKGLTERGFSCLFYDFGTLLKEIQNSYNPLTQTSELSVLSPVLNIDVLVLDELGASKPTAWVNDTLAHVINTRYNEKKFTIFTTNFLDERPDERKETLEDRIGVRTRSRLYEMCETVLLAGEDYRRTFDRATVPVT